MTRHYAVALPVIDFADQLLESGAEALTHLHEPDGELSDERDLKSNVQFVDYARGSDGGVMFVRTSMWAGPVLVGTEPTGSRQGPLRRTGALEEPVRRWYGAGMPIIGVAPVEIKEEEKDDAGGSDVT